MSHIASREEIDKGVAIVAVTVGQLRRSGFIGEDFDSSIPDESVVLLCED